MAVKKKIRGFESIKKDLEKAYHRAGGMRYLLDIAHKDPKLFVSLLTKLVPTEINATVTHNTIDLGAAMVEAQRRLNSSIDADQPQIIDITPEQDQEKEPVRMDDLL